MKRNHANVRGFSLVEVVVALGIAAFALTIIFALLTSGLTSNSVSTQRTVAINLATGIVADLRQTPTASQITASGSTLVAHSPRYGIDLTQASTTLYLDDSGVSSAGLAADSHYKAIITLTQPSSGQRLATYGTVLVGWPAAAANPSNSISAFIALDRN